MGGKQHYVPILPTELELQLVCPEILIFICECPISLPLILDIILS